MSDYTRLRPAISHYEASCRESLGPGFKGAAAHVFGDMQSKYFSKTDNPDYSSPLHKFCYLFKYTIANGYYVFRTLKLAREKARKDLFPPQGMRIACIGGGPGSEIVGVARYLREIEPHHRSVPLEFVVFDRERTWETVGKKVVECLSDCPNISVVFIEMDATDPSSYTRVDFSRFGIVVSSFFLSETRKQRIATVTRKFWRYMLGSLSRGTWLVAVDFADASSWNLSYLATALASAGRPFFDVVNEAAITMSCPDSKAAILALEAELDHRPRKNATNLVRVVAAG